MRYYVVGILLALDILLNAILAGDHYTTISHRVGESIRNGGWASRVPWPKWLRQHFVEEV